MLYLKNKGVQQVEPLHEILTDNPCFLVKVISVVLNLRCALDGFHHTAVDAAAGLHGQLPTEGRDVGRDTGFRAVNDLHHIHTINPCLLYTSDAADE